MNKKLAKVIMMGLLCASVLPSVGEAQEIGHNLVINQSGTQVIGYDVIYGDVNNPAIKIPYYDTDNVNTNEFILNFNENKKTVIYSDIEGLLIDGNRKVSINGNGLQILDSNTVGVEPSYHSSINNDSLYTNVVFNVPIEIVTNIHSGVKNIGKMEFNNDLDISITNGGVYNAAIDSTGELIIKSKNLALVNLNDGNVIDVGTSGPVSKFKLYSDAEASETRQVIIGNINCVGADVDIHIKGKNSGFTGTFNGAYNTTTAPFCFKLTDGATWYIPNGNSEGIDNLILDNASVYLYNNFSEMKYSNLSIYDFQQNNSEFYLHTNLKDNQGDRIDFMGDAVNNYVSVYFTDMQAQGGNPIKEEDGHSVTLVQVYNDSNVVPVISSTSAYYGSDNKIYKPVIKVEDAYSKGNTKYGIKYNFVGWSHTDDLGNDFGERDYIPTFPDEPHILVEDIEPIFKRLNDLRTDPSEVGVWMRGETGETKIRSYSYDHNVMSGGYDWENKTDEGILFTGVSFTYSTNDCDDSLIGDTKSYGINAYGSWLGKKNNDYVDLVVKYGKLDKDYAGYDRNNIFCSGDYDKDLFTVSAKYGRRIFKDDWYWEPSVGVAWGRVGSASFVDNHGLNIHADSTNSLITSLGMQVGKNIKGIEYYGKAEVMHDFDGKIHVSAPGIVAEDDMGGTWVKCAIGASRKIDENNSFYLEVERDFGNKVEKPYGVSLGYRFTW